MISERTEQLFLQSEGQQVSSNQQISGAGGSSTLDGLRRSDEIWHALRKEKSWQKEPAQIVRINDKPYQRAVAEFDVVVCGGTLGLFYAVAMQLKGYKVCIIERGRVAGRPQEWNISEKELSVLVNLGLLKEADIKKIISIKFNPARVGFKYDTSPDAPQNGFELYVEDVLNLGVNPSTLIELLKERFLINGGILYENAALETVSVHPNLAAVTIAQSSAKEGFEVTARLVVDSMGNASPISRQARGPIEPDGICIVVGSCARGFQASNNTYSDVICTNTPISDVGPGSQTQFFWEAFPTGSGPTDRTTYMYVTYSRFIT